MAKLYAELTSDKGGRVVGKGGEHFTEMKVTHNNRHLWTIHAGQSGTLTITRNGKTIAFHSLNWPPTA